MTLYASVLWFYTAMASLVFGASVFESVVVHPAWSRKPPESFASFMAAPISRLNLPAFWVPVAPLYALSALLAIVVAYRDGTPSGFLMLSSACKRRFR